jgi:Flp pilus assembly protein TadD
VPVAEVAKQLGVAFVVEGSVRRDASRVRITVQLIKAADGFQLWTNDYDRELKDIFSVQDEIAGLIAKNLQLQIGDALAAPRATVDPEAFRLFLAGRAQAEKASIEGLSFGVTDMQKAAEIDPKFAAAWAQLARAYIQLTRWGGIDIESGYEKARGAVAKAVALEPDSPEVLVAQGWVKRTADWDWKGARQAFKRALELQPNNPDTLADAAVFFFNTGQTSEGLELARRAADLDPLNAQTQVNLSLAFMCSGELNRAEQAGRRAIQLSPSGPRYHGSLAIILAVLDRPQKAEQEASLETDELSRRTAFAFVSIDRGAKLKAAAQARQIEELAPARGQSADIHAYAAEVYSMLNDKDSAFASLQRSLAARDPALAWIKVDPSFRNLHGDPRWDVLVGKIGLADDQLK